MILSLLGCRLFAMRWTPEGKTQKKVTQKQHDAELLKGNQGSSTITGALLTNWLETGRVGEALLLLCVLKA